MKKGLGWMRFRRVGSVALLLVALTGCGFLTTAPTIPVAFWSNLRRMPHASWFSGFPHAVNSRQACTIPAVTGPITGATCATSLRTVHPGDLFHIPLKKASLGWRTVLLTETWDHHVATFAFVISVQGQILGLRLIGKPPQTLRPHATP